MKIIKSKRYRDLEKNASRSGIVSRMDRLRQRRGLEKKSPEEIWMEKIKKLKMMEEGGEDEYNKFEDDDIFNEIQYRRKQEKEPIPF